MKKKYLLALLCTALLGTVLIGCNSNNDTKTTEKNNNTNQVSTEQTSQKDKNAFKTKNYKLTKINDDFKKEDGDSPNIILKDGNHLNYACETIDYTVWRTYCESTAKEALEGEEVYINDLYFLNKKTNELYKTHFNEEFNKHLYTGHHSEGFATSSEEVGMKTSNKLFFANSDYNLVELTINESDVTYKEITPLSYVLGLKENTILYTDKNLNIMTLNTDTYETNMLEFTDVDPQTIIKDLYQPAIDYFEEYDGVKDCLLISGTPLADTNSDTTENKYIGFKIELKDGKYVARNVPTE